MSRRISDHLPKQKPKQEPPEDQETVEQFLARTGTKIEDYQVPSDVLTVKEYGNYQQRVDSRKRYPHKPEHNK